MQSLNQCQFIGNLGRDPEVRYSPDGSAVANFSLGCNWKTKNGEGTEWVRVVAFGKLGEIVGQYLFKGSKAYVSGRMTTRKWTDKDGQEKYTTEIVAESLLMLDGKKQERESNSLPPKATTADDDSIPF